MEVPAVKKIFAAVLLGLAVPLCGVPGVVAPAPAQAANGWHLAGKYRSYEAACRKADHLEACGYETRVVKQDCYYCVYCK
jgi:hypothetical protein